MFLMTLIPVALLGWMIYYAYTASESDRPRAVAWLLLLGSPCFVFTLSLIAEKEFAALVGVPLGLMQIVIGVFLMFSTFVKPFASVVQTALDYTSVVVKPYESRMEQKKFRNTVTGQIVYREVSDPNGGQWLLFMNGIAYAVSGAFMIAFASAFN